MANYGTRNAFQIFGTGAGLAGVTYFLLHRLYLVQMERLRLRRKSGNCVITLTFQCQPFSHPPLIMQSELPVSLPVAKKSTTNQKKNTSFRQITFWAAAKVVFNKWKKCIVIILAQIRPTVSPFLVSTRRADS